MSRKADALVFLPSNFGDVLLTLPALLHLSGTHARIDAVASPQTAAFVATLPFVNDVFPYNKKTTLQEKAVFFWGKRGYGTFIDFRHTCASLVAWASRSTPLLRGAMSGHKSHTYLRLVADTIEVPPERSTYWPVGKEFLPLRGELEGLITGKAVFAIPCSKSALKVYPPQLFAAFLSRLAGAYPVVLIGGKEDVTAAQQIKDALHADVAVIDLVGKTAFADIFALMQRYALCVVCADTAPMHAASFLNIPTLALFGPTDPVRYGPYAQGSAVLRAAVSCVGCMQPSCPKGVRCMESIDPDDVYRAFKGIVPAFRMEETKVSSTVELPRRFR